MFRLRVKRNLSVRALSLVALLGLVMSVGMQTAEAAGKSSNITTSPIAVDLSIKAGETKTTTLQMQNNGPLPVVIDVELQTFKAKGSNGQPDFILPSNQDPALKYVSFSRTRFTAQPSVWSPVNMTISLPKNASLGYYYAVMFKPVLTINKQTVVNSAYTPSNAVLVLVDTHSGNERRQVQVKSFISAHKVYEYLPAEFSVTIHNNGNIYIVPSGTVYISRGRDFKNVLATLDMNKASGRVLPNSDRVFKVAWRDGFPRFEPEMVAGQPVLTKQGQPVEQLKWDFSKANHLRFGRYYARLVVAYNDGKRDVPITSVVSFWVIPWKIIGIILLIVLLQVGLVVAFVRSRRALKTAKKQPKSDATKPKGES